LPEKVQQTGLEPTINGEITGELPFFSVFRLVLKF
jgi:hypothetical protein